MDSFKSDKSSAINVRKRQISSISADRQLKFQVSMSDPENDYKSVFAEQSLSSNNDNMEHCQAEDSTVSLKFHCFGHQVSAENLNP